MTQEQPESHPLTLHTAPKRRRPTIARPGLWLIVLLALAATIYGILCWRATQADAGPSYRVAAANVGPVTLSVSATGTLQPWTTVDIKSKAGGRVDQLLVDVGSVVKAGQILARIDPTDSLLTYNQARADTDAAKAKESQSATTYELQFRSADVAVDQAQAALRSAEANRDAAYARWQTAVAQSAVQPRQTEAAIRQAEANYQSLLRQKAELAATQQQERIGIQAAYDQAVATEMNARIYYQRTLDLFKQGFIAANDVDQSESAAKVAAAQLASAKAKLDTIEIEQKAAMESIEAKTVQANEQLAAARAQVDIAARRNSASEALAAYRQSIAQFRNAQAALRKAEVDRLNNRIKALDIAGAKASTSRAAAALENAKTTLDQTVVRAPSAGIVLQKYVEQGTIITSGLSMTSSGTSLLQIGDLSKLYVSVLVDETDIASVRLGQHVSITVDSYPERPFVGVVSRIDPQAQVSQNVTSIAVRVEIDNRQRRFELLKPNMNATCDFMVEERPSVVRVPAEAVSQQRGESYVQVIKSVPGAVQGGVARGAKPERRRVKTGLEGDDYVEILEGLREGDLVVIQTVATNRTSTNQMNGGSPFGSRGPGGGPGGR